MQRRWCLEFIIVCRLCQAAYTLLEAAPPLTIGLRQSMPRFTVNLQSHIKRVTRGCARQSNDVWPREETSSLSADAEQDEEHKAKEGHTRIRRRRSDKRAVRMCAQHTKRDRTIDTGREGTLRKYKNKLRLIANRRLSIARKRREIQQTGGLAPLAATMFLPLLSQLFA